MNSIFKTMLCGGVLAASLAAEPTSVNSQANNGVIFGGIVGFDRECQILIVEDGIIAPNVGNTVLSSIEAGGRPGFAQIRTSRNLNFQNNPYVITAEPLIGFTQAPPELTSAVEFSANYDVDFRFFSFFNAQGLPAGPSVASGQLNDVDSTATLTVIGANALRADITMDYIATIAAGETFPSGNYTAQVTLRCE